MALFPSPKQVNPLLCNSLFNCKRNAFHYRSKITFFYGPPAAGPKGNPINLEIKILFGHNGAIKNE
ncbi:hypothetical protein LQ236_000534 [Nitrospina gracilis]|nr:hypothetical protein [Nitrospina sp. Nb-3]